MKYKEIPIHKMSDEYGIDCYVKYFERGTAPSRLSNYPAHRDDNFLFIIADGGYGSFEVDFHNVDRHGRGFFHVCPGQIHSNINVDESDFWCVLISPHLISKRCVDVLYEYPRRYEFAPMTDVQYHMIDGTLKMLAGINNIPEENRINIRNALIDTFINISMQIIQLRAKTGGLTESEKTRKSEIAENFCKAVYSNVPRVKTVKEYADMLKISPIYLNEAVKSHTGQTPSEIIIEEMILEAKRQLVFSSISVKEIAFILGLDESYMSRLFKKRAGISPISFRQQYQK